MELNTISTARELQVVNQIHDSSDIQHNGAVDEKQNSTLHSVDNQSSQKSILDISEHHFWLRMFLIVTANYWPPGATWFALCCKSHWLFTRCAILFCTGFAGFTSIGILSHIVVHKSGAVFLPIFVALFLASASVLPAQYFNRFRVSAPLIAEERAAIDACLKATCYFAVASVMCSIASVVVTAVWTSRAVRSSNSYYLALGFIIPQLYVVLALSFNMFFFMLDLHTSAAMLYQLHFLADQRQLLLEKFNWARNAIETRAKASRWASDFIIVPCIASALGIVIAVLLIDRLARGDSVSADDDDDNHGDHTVVELQFAGILLSLLKELIYLFVAFWYVARVNEQADDLTVKLSRGFWAKSSLTDLESEHSPDMHRLSIHASSVSEPITYSLLFKRVSKQNVLLSGAGLAFTILVGIIKNSVEAQ